MINILWIEEEGYSLMQYKTPLVRAGYKVDIAGTASDAINFLRRMRYDVLIVDLILPAGDDYVPLNINYIGLDLLKQLHSRNKYTEIDISQVPVIVFSIVNDSSVHKELQSLKKEIILMIKSQKKPTDLKDAVDELLPPKKN